MDSIIITFVVTFLGIVILPWLAPKFRMPVIVLELLFGIVIGKTFLDLVPENEIIDFFSEFGLVFLMFLAGMEIDMTKLNIRILKKVTAIVVASLLVPFLSGIALSYWVDINPFLMGTLMCTTSLGLLLPVLKDLPLTKRQSQLLLASVIIVDLASMFILAFVLSALQGTLDIQFLYSIVAIIVLFLIPMLINKRKLRRKFTQKVWKRQYFELEMRVSFAVIFLLAAASFKLGFHSIIGAFIGGLLVSEILPKATLQEEKLQSFGYSFFIPMFFIFVGAQVNLIPVFSNLDNVIVLVVIVAAGLVSKLVGVTFASRLSGLKIRQSLAFGMFHTARLSLVIAAVDISLKLNLIDESLFAIFILLAIISAIIAPSFGKSVLAPNTR